jgi:hypothetical protein
MEFQNHLILLVIVITLFLLCNNTIDAFNKQSNNDNFNSNSFKTTKINKASTDFFKIINKL